MDSTTTQTTQPEAPFGMVQAFLAGTLFLLGGLLAVPLYLIKFGQASPVDIVGGLFTEQQYLFLNLALWILEAALYFGVSWVAGRRDWLVGAIGMVLGFILRLCVALLIAFLLSARSGDAATLVFTKMNGEFWLLRLLAIVTSTVTLLLPFRGLLLAGFRFQGNSARKFEDTAKHFSFRAPVEPMQHATPARKIARVGGQEDGPVAPPEGFTPLPPQIGISGMVNISVEVVCASVPEAKPYLQPGIPVRVRLAFLVPQLPHATAWLTWQQIFSSGHDDPNYQHGPDRPDTNFQGRWVQLPAHAYVTQVPREYFAPATTPNTPKWMKRSPVPQEEQFASIEKQTAGE